MSILTPAQARAQCRVESDYPDEQIQPYIDGAEDMASAYLNRAIFADPDALNQAQDDVPAELGAANAAYAAAIAAAAVIDDPLQKQGAIDIADARLDQAKVAAARITHGIVVNGSIVAALLLTVGRLFAFREDVVANDKVVALPGDAIAFLRPYRRVMTP